VGTLSGALVRAAVFRLLDYGSHRYIGESTSFFSGAIYVLIVLFLPYGIVGTWIRNALDIKAGRGRLLTLVFRGKKVESDSE